MNNFIYGNTPQDTGVLGFTELIEEIAEALLLSPQSQLLAIADIQARYRLSDEQVSDLLALSEEEAA